ncbi:DUF7296 family protein [Streptosporangium canum]|uniref:DUF7296 family protein n=1 Tax=Streptosporangium canum TaxID=324952 RepID=UPI003F4B5FB3
MFFQFSQNNSGGSFVYDDDGTSVLVVVEADNATEANERAEDIGLYFDGSVDCSCCGPRWNEAWDGDGDDYPAYFGTNLLETELWYWPWMTGGRAEGFIHYKNGNIDAVMVQDGVVRIQPWKRPEPQKAIAPKKPTRKLAKESA